MNVDEAISALEACLIGSFDLLKLDSEVDSLANKKDLLGLENIRQTYLAQIEKTNTVKDALQQALNSSTDTEESRVLISYIKSTGLLLQGHAVLLGRIDEALAHVNKTLTSTHGSN